MIDAKQLRYEIIRPALEYLDPVIPYSMAAENLLMGTCAQESRMGTFIKQINGPARGIFQMEPSTHIDIYDRYLKYKDDLSAKLAPFKHSMHFNQIGNLHYQAIMARIHYYRVPMALPEEDSIEGMGHYWKLFYNTPEGRGTIQEFIDNYGRFVA